MKSRTWQKRVAWALMGMVCAVVAGCAGGTHTPRSGFLSNYEDLQQDPSDKSLW